MVRGKRIWDITRVPDRDETKAELPDLIRFNGGCAVPLERGKYIAIIPRGGDGSTYL